MFRSFFSIIFRGSSAVFCAVTIPPADLRSLSLYYYAVCGRMCMSSVCVWCSCLLVICWWSAVLSAVTIPHADLRSLSLYYYAVCGRMCMSSVCVRCSCLSPTTFQMISLAINVSSFYWPSSRSVSPLNEVAINPKDKMETKPRH